MWLPGISLKKMYCSCRLLDRIVFKIFLASFEGTKKTFTIASVVQVVNRFSSRCLIKQDFLTGQFDFYNTCDLLLVLNVPVLCFDISTIYLRCQQIPKISDYL